MDAASERPEYLGRGPDAVYCVLHRAAGVRRGAVLLLGPMALERTHAHLVWVRWARHLAASGFDVLRFDYRGVGESCGRFEDMTLGAWEEDASTCLAHLVRECPGVPVVLHGLRLGALLAARLFTTRGDALLLWEPPESGQAHLMDVLRRKLTADNMEQTGGVRRTRDEYLADLEARGTVEVEGYPWSRALWRSAADVPLALPAEGDARPWRVVHLDGRSPERCLAPGRSTSLRPPRPVFWTSSHLLVPNLAALHADGLAFLGTLAHGEARA